MGYLGRISAKEHHSMQMILRLAKTYYTKKPASLKEIGAHEQVSVKYLEQLILPFRKAGWLKSRRGRVGGYIMTKNPKTISVRDVMLLIEDHPGLAVCIRQGAGARCPMEKTCPSKNVWREIQNAMDRSMENLKLSELIIL